MEGGWSEGDSEWADNDCYSIGRPIKMLRKVWRTQRLRRQGFTPATTLIVEDTPSNCVSNYGNAIYVRTYCALSSADDSMLPHLTRFLAHLAATAPDDVRPPEKRNWHAYSYAEPRPCCCYSCLRRLDRKSAQNIQLRP